MGGPHHFPESHHSGDRVGRLVWGMVFGGTQKCSVSVEQLIGRVSNPAEPTYSVDWLRACQEIEELDKMPNSFFLDEVGNKRSRRMEIRTRSPLPEPSLPADSAQNPVRTQL